MKSKTLMQGLVAAILIAGSLWKLELKPHAGVAAGIAAYQQGDFEKAMHLFEAAADGYHSVTLQKNLALAALRFGDLESARTATALVASLGNAEDLIWHDFLLGNLAWKRSLRAEVEAHGPVPPAGALERAIAQAEVARDAWQAVLDAESGWPEAQRNLQRVTARLLTLAEELASSTGGDTPESTKMPSPSEADTPPVSEAKQLQMMQQLERLDQQHAMEQAAQKPKPSGGWEW